MTIVFEAKSLLARTAALAAMVLTQSGAALAVPAADKAFTVANYPVEARAQDAVTAKDRAMTDGQQAAFRSLLKRIVPVTAYESLKRLKSIKAADLIDGVSIRSERNSSTEYLASLDFTFQPDGVRTILRREGVPFIDTQAPEALLIPVVREGAGAAGAAGTWTEAWQNLDVVHTLTPLKLEKLKPEIHSDTLRSLTDGTGAAERILIGEYKSGLIVAAVADIDVPGKRLHVTLAGRDAVGPINWKRSYRMASGEQAYALELAAVVGLGVLEGRWKAAQAGARGGVEAITGPGAAVQLLVEFTSIGQWNEIRSHLLETQGIEDVRIEGVSARSADVLLRYPGGAPRLADALAARGMALRDESGTWVLRSRF
ncbi:MAG: hypothetical protein CTY20_12080 [Hyphomicrobium sp.]|nr:MAG: hypothetical protein CTY20_12080 [Hyphomicrobium sp.]